MVDSRLDYLRRRAMEEKQRAISCKEPKIAAIHQRMAELYADRVSALSDNPDFDPIVHTQVVRD